MKRFPRIFTQSTRYYSSSVSKNILSLSPEKCFPHESKTSGPPLSVSDYRERMSLIEACLKSNQQARARILFKALMHSSGKLSEQFMDIHVHNSFLESFLSGATVSGATPGTISSGSTLSGATPGTTSSGTISSGPAPSGTISPFNPPRKDSFAEMLQWFHSIKSSSILPNVTSYALLFKGALHSQNTSQLTSAKREMAQVIAADLQRTLKVFDVGLDHVFESHVLSEHEVSALKLLLLSDAPLDNLSVVVDPFPSSAAPAESPASPQFVADSFQTVPVPLIKQAAASSSLGMEYIRKSLLSTTTTSPAISSLVDLQIHIEQESFRLNLDHLLSRSEKVRDMTGIGILSPVVKHMVGLWLPHFTAVVRRELEKLKLNHALESDSTSVAPFLEMFMHHPAAATSSSSSSFGNGGAASSVAGRDALEKVAAAVISQFIRAFNAGDMRVKAVQLVSGIGDAVEQEWRVMLLSDRRVKEKFTKDYLSHQQLLASPPHILTQKLRTLVQSQKVLGDFELTSWERATKIRLGSVLAGWFLQNVKIPVRVSDPSILHMKDRSGVSSNSNSDFDVTWVNAFGHGYHREHSKIVGIITAHDALVRAMDSPTVTSSDALGSSSGGRRDGVVLPKLLPMIVKPRPWLTHDSGGYLTIKAPFMRTFDLQTAGYLREGSLTGKLDPIFRALDILGATPWRVHDKLLSHIIHAWNNNLAICKLPRDVPSEAPKVPEKPADWDVMEKVERFKWHAQCKKILSEYWDQKGLRISENYKIEIARSFVGKTIYFPHNIDFRGRAYPIPQLFNHMGNDLSRSLLIFDKAKPLGPTGLRWLKIHLANVFGNDKISFDERVRFVDDRLELIKRCADDPFGTGNEWWQTADKPWLTLSASLELTAALSSPNPELYETRLPVHQDGSCNGLQHYAALGGDLEGAQQVNLVSVGDRPADVYNAVADKVQASIIADLQTELSPSQLQKYETYVQAGNLGAVRYGEMEDGAAKRFLAAGFPAALVERKTVKQTVMTSVYGVTFVGARAQILARLREKHLATSFSDGAAVLATATTLDDASASSDSAAASSPQPPPPPAAAARKYTEDELNVVSHYLTKKVFEAIKDMFGNAHAIQNWLTSVAREIARSVEPQDLDDMQGRMKEQQSFKKELRERKKVSGGAKEKTKSEKTGGAGVSSGGEDSKIISLNSKSAVIWTTPIGLTCIQPYKFTKNREIRTALQSFVIRNQTHKAGVDVVKQAAAFPPNFVHSLDATHMFMTVLACADQPDPITFASVHDSYWTHPSDVAALRDILRAKFVELHERPILADLWEEFVERYGDRMIHNMYGVEEFAQKLEKMNERGSVKYRLDKGQQRIVYDTVDFGHQDEPQRGLDQAVVDERQPWDFKPETDMFDEANACHNVTDDVDHDDLPTRMDDESTFSSKLKTTAAAAIESVETSEEAAALAHAALCEKIGLTRKCKFVRIWEKLEVPPVPKKGDFDVATVKTSEYFFN